MEIKIVIMLMTTSNSISVKPFLERPLAAIGLDFSAIEVIGLDGFKTKSLEEG